MKSCSLIPLGDLREPVTFQRKMRAQGADGGTTDVWVSFRSGRAHVKASSGREVWAGDRTEARALWKVTCRYFPGLLESDRVLIRGQAYNIRHIDNVELRNRWYVITAEKGVAS